MSSIAPQTMSTNKRSLNRESNQESREAAVRFSPVTQPSARCAQLHGRKAEEACSSLWLSDKHGQLYESDNGRFPSPRESASDGLSGSSESEMAHLNPQTCGNPTTF
jgi:hypothetical protein